MNSRTGTQCREFGCRGSLAIRWVARLAILAITAVAATIPANAFATATVTSDRDDYLPGDTAFLSGSGWLQGETVRLDVVCTGAPPPETHFATVNSAGDFSGVAVEITSDHAYETCTVTATGLTSWQSARTTFTDAPLGSGRLSNVTPVDGGCVFQDSIPTNAVESWDVEQGRTYDVTLTNVTDCANGGTDATIEIIVKNSNTGNQCLTATTAGTGVYVFTVSMPTNACFTSPIQYCTSGCSPSTGSLARRADGGSKQSHLNASTFGANCSNPTPDTNCGAGCAVSIDCPADFAVCNDQSECSAVVGFSVTATGNCPPFTVVCSPTAGSEFPAGTTTVNCTATDSSSATDSCSFNVTVNDCEPPSITCPQNIVVCNDTGGCDAVVSFEPSVDDNCLGATFVCSPASGSTFSKGTTPVTCTATDSGGNTDTCSFTVTVNDCDPPSIMCPQNIVVCNDTGRCDAVVSFEPSVDDNCLGATFVCSPSSGSIFLTGTTPVTCTATDGSGNQASCSFSVTVNDCDSPTITCPSDITVCNGSERCDAVVSFQATAGDNCPGVTVTCVPPSGSTFPKGTTPVTCTATDESGNQTSCSFNVTVNDCDPPTITCPGNLTACNDPERCDASVSYQATAGDNCPGVTVACVPPSGSTFPKGTTAVTCTATDGSGNTASCSFTVTVNDCDPPTVTCPGDITVCNTRGQCDATVSFQATPSDNCPGVTVACVPPSGSTFPKGTTPVTCNATDDSGNTASCSFNVTVNDCEPPTLTCPDDIHVDVHDTNDADVTFEPSVNDNCPGVIVVCDPPSGTTFPPGCTTVVCMATDCGGNIVSCEFQVCVQTCVGFDNAGDGGAVPADTIITTQYEALGLHVEGLSDTGFPRALARHQGAPGSATDDLIPVSGLNYLQTDAGDGTSDSGFITFTFVDPIDGSPRLSSFARLTFLDIEGSGFGAGGAGRTRLEAFDPNGALIETQLVPRSLVNGSQQVVQIGTMGGPLRIAMVVATIGNQLDSGGVDEFCYMLNPPDTELSVLVSDPTPSVGETSRAKVFMRNNSPLEIATEYSLYAGFQVTQVKRWGQRPTALNMAAHMDGFVSPLDYPLLIPANRPRIIGRRVYLVATLRSQGTAVVLSQSVARFVVQP